MAQTAVIKIVVRRGTLAEWTASNPVLLSGEIGFITDTNLFVIGNGVKTFLQLYDINPVTTSTNLFLNETYIVQNLLNPLSTALQTQITNEANARSAADVAINLALSNEITDRTNADTSLQSQITTEVNARITGDNNLNTYITSVDTTLTAAISNLETNILTWYGTAQNVGDILVYDGFSFQVLPVGINGQALRVSTASPIGLEWQTDAPIVAGDMTKSVYDPDNDGIVESAEREQIAVINKTGATLTKGTIVYIKSSSSSANYPEVLKASATTELTSSKTIGAVYEDIADSAVGYIITSGQVHNLNTSAYTVGTKLWLSTTAGEVTTTPPTQPYHTVFIGFVTRSQPQNGRVLYAIQNGYELGELHDVFISGTPQNDDVLTYNGGLWQRNSIPNILGFYPADSIDLINGLATKEDVIPTTSPADYWRGDKTWQPLNKTAVGLSNVDNTSDADKPISTATQTALNAKENTITAGTTAQYWRGDKSWQTLNKAAVGLSNVDNTSDANKPISSATQTALNAKENTISAGTTSQYWRGDKSWQTLDKSAVGLANVDNTSDANKPISTATQSALDTISGDVTTLQNDITNLVPYTGATGNVELGDVVINASDANTIAQLQKDLVLVQDIASTSIVELSYQRLKFTDNIPITPTTTEYGSVGIKFADGTTQTTKAQPIITLTTTGSSGAATFVGNVLNIPQYSGGGGGVTQNDAIAYAIALG